MNKKGFTLMELLVSIVLVSIVLVTMLSTLNKIKNTYDVINSNVDVSIYSSSLSRIINNDINKNGGIKFISCNLDGTYCELYLSNNNKRKLEIYPIELSDDCKLYDEEDRSRCVTQKISNVLKYSDLETEDIIYIKTLSLLKTKNDSNEAKVNGNIFGRMYTTYVSFPNSNNQGYTSTLSSLTIEINDTIDTNNHSNNVILYSAANYETNSIKVGDQIDILLDNLNDDEPVSFELDNLALKYSIGYYKVNNNGKLIKVEDNNIFKVKNSADIAKPNCDGYTFGGYYYFDISNSSEIQIIDENGNLKVGNTFFSTKGMPITLYAKWIGDFTVDEFDYTGNEQTFTASKSGWYKLETWGAQGGSVKYSGKNHIGGYGGYSRGYTYLSKNQMLYINVGGQGKGGSATDNYPGGYNGGGSTKNNGSDHYHASGGGATHIATSSGLLKDKENAITNVLIVSGGGGGAYRHTASINYSSDGGAGGGYIGVDATNVGSSSGKYGLGGSQTSGGKYKNSTETTSTIFGSFGLGGTPSASWGSAGGGGFYGGGASYGNTNSNGNSGGGGGSSYIANQYLYNKVMYCYNCQSSNEFSTRTISTNCNNEDAISECTKQGNGHARISYAGNSIDGDYETAMFNYTGNEQAYLVPKDGYYKLETWGAQGGGNSASSGGLGGYSTGITYLKKDEKIYVVVGGQGGSADSSKNYGGYNGGGFSGYNPSYPEYTSFGGGGATHIAKKQGLLASLSANDTNLLIVSGGGGGGAGPLTTRGGDGGGFIGNPHTSSIAYYNNSTYIFPGGSQTAAGVSSESSRIGGFGYAIQENNPNGGYGGGEGGGYYGGAAGVGTTGSGGSGYIGNANLFNKAMYCYNCQTSSDNSTKTISNTCSNSNALAECSKLGNGYAKISYLGSNFELGSENATFNYTGSEQTYIAPKTGYYKLETWGAQGGGQYGGYGAFSSGYVYLNQYEMIYVNVGGSTSNSSPGYNGGGSADGHFGGGGATHIALTSGLLKNLSGNINDIIIVAGGGGGTSGNGSGGSAGGIVGSNGTDGECTGKAGFGGTQTTGGSCPDPNYCNFGIFGQGGSLNIVTEEGNTGGAGGGGFYGGGTGTYGGCYGGGGGGSSYIGNSLLQNKHMYCYNCTTSDSASTKTYTTTNVSAAPTSNYAKSGNGYAKITYVGTTLAPQTYIKTQKTCTAVPAVHDCYATFGCLQSGGSCWAGQNVGSGCKVSGTTDKCSNYGGCWLPQNGDEYSYTFSNTNSTVTSCSTSASFTCDASTSGNSYVSSCVPAN